MNLDLIHIKSPSRNKYMFALLYSFLLSRNIIIFIILYCLKPFVCSKLGIFKHAFFEYRSKFIKITLVSYPSILHAIIGFLSPHVQDHADSQKVEIPD